MLLGAHISIAGGFDKVCVRGAEATCEAIQVFVKNNNQWNGRSLAAAECDAFKRDLKPNGIRAVIAHNIYLSNFCATKPENLEKTIASTIDELQRCHQLGIPWLVLHPGSHLGMGEAWGLAKAAGTLNLCLKETSACCSGVLLETTSGQGTNLGYKFEHLAEILRRVRSKKRMGVCLDTCHIFTAGYDIRTAAGWRKTMRQFDRIIGLDKLKAVHLNDSKKELGSRRDRHEHIGKGAIGIEGFRAIINDKRLKNIPGLLETPVEQDPQDNIDNLNRLRALRK